MPRWRRTLAMPVSIAARPRARSVRGSSSMPPWCLIARTVVHEHDGARGQPAEAADDVEELLHAHVRAEARLGHDVVAELHADEVGDERVVAVGDVGERAAVHQARLALERLDQVGLERVLEQHGHGARGAEVLGGDRRAAVEGLRDGDRAEAAAQVLQVARDGHDGHDLGGRGDVEAALARVAVGAAAEARRSIWRRARSFMSIARRQPTRSASICSGLPCRIEASSIAASRLLAAPMAWMSPVKCRLRSSIGTTWVMPPPAAPPLMPNTGPERGLAQARTGRLPMTPEALRQADQRGRLALAGLGRRHAGRRTRACRRARRSGGRGRRGRSSPCSGRRARTPRLRARPPRRSARSA